MQQNQNGRTLLHLINLSGHSQTGYFPPVPMTNIQIRIAGNFRKAKTVGHPALLNPKVDRGYSEFTIANLLDYELVVLE